MISYDPNNYAATDLKDDKFYRDLLANSVPGVSPAAVVIEPFSRSYAAAVPAPIIYYFDISEVSPVGSSTVPGHRVFFHGNLNMTTYCDIFGGVGTFRVDLLTTSGYTFNVLYRPVTAIDTTYLCNMQFTSIAFGLIQCTAVGTASNISFNFTGVKISY